MADSNLPTEELEPLIFSKNLYREMYVETNIALPEHFDDFKKQVEARKGSLRTYATAAAGFGFLHILANNYFKNEYLPAEWRTYLSEQPNESVDDNTGDDQLSDSE